MKIGILLNFIYFYGAWKNSRKEERILKIEVKSMFTIHCILLLNTETVHQMSNMEQDE
jgi:hypothetical protein